MRNLTIGDLKLALRDLLGDKLAELQRSATGRLYEPRLRAKQKQIEAIPDAVAAGAPLAGELSEADSLHDGLGAAVFYLCRAIDTHPTLAAPIKTAARDVQAQFVPQLDVLRAPYADEAAAALDNRPELAKLKAAAKSVATPGGGSLYDWVKSFLGAGDALDRLLRQRAATLAVGENASGTGPLRGATVGLLGRFREALRDETDEGELSPEYDARIFAYIDKLNADRERTARSKAGTADGETDATGEAGTAEGTATDPGGGKKPIS